MMSMLTYRGIIEALETNFAEKDCLKLVARAFPEIPRGTLLSISSQHCQLHTKHTHGRHRRPETMESYYQRYQSARHERCTDELLLKMAKEVHLAPTLYARIILEQYAVNNSLVPASTTPNVVVSQWIKSPGGIPDSILHKQVKVCILNDPNYGPLAENVKHSVGYEYEFLLREKIEELQLPFLDEHDLRARGYDKTPDFKLEVPIAVGDHIVNWIESKASFGDEQSHRRYLEEQFWSYQNRFGPGMVIYWFGYIEELDTHSDQGILLAFSFPAAESLVRLTHPRPTLTKAD